MSTPLKKFLKTSLPAVVDLASQTFMWAVEAIFIGHLNAAALAGVGMALQIIILTFTIVLTFMVGSSLIINLHLGKNEKFEANHILAQALMLSLVMSFLIALVWYFGASQLFTLIREKEHTAREYGITYMKTLAYASPFIVLNFVALGVVRGAGDTHWSMLINLIINVINLIFAPLMIFGYWGFPRWETYGAAIAVSIAHTTGFFLTLWLLRSRKCSLFLSFREVTTPNWGSFKRLFKVGIPTTLEQLFWSSGQLIVTTFAAQAGIVVLATHQILLRIQAILGMIYMGFSLSAMTLVGQHVGAENHDIAVHTESQSRKTVALISIAIALVLFFIGRPITALFTPREEVIELGAFVFKIMAVVQIPRAVVTVMNGSIRGTGDVHWLMWIAFLTVLIFELGGSWVMIFTLNLGLVGLWLMQGGEELFRLGFYYWRFKGAKWKVFKI